MKRTLGVHLLAVAALVSCDSAPGPGNSAYRLEVVNEDIWELVTTERMPPYVYAGEWHDARVVSFFPQKHLAVDLWQDGFLDVMVPLIKGYASGIDTRMPLLLFKNEGGTLIEASDELVGELPYIPGLSRSAAFARASDPFHGVFGVQNDTGDGRFGDAILIGSGEAPVNRGSRLPTLPLSDDPERPHKVSAHSMAGGDITGNDRTDFVVGEWEDEGGGYWLIQEADGTWSVRPDQFLYDVVHVPGNALLDLHLADLNGNGFDDLIAGYGHGPQESYVFFNDGNGAFSFDDAIPLPGSVYAPDNSLHLKTISFDIDGDGDLDLLIVHSRETPYYAGVSLQLLVNDGSGTFTDESSTRMINLPGPDRAFELAAGWSDDYTLIDVNGDGIDDLIGSDELGVRLWIRSADGVFTEVEIEAEHSKPSAWYTFMDMGDGTVGSLTFRQSWLDAEGTTNRIWFEQHVLVPPQP